MSQPSFELPTDWAAATQKINSIKEIGEPINTISGSFDITEVDDLRMLATALVNQAKGPETEVAAGNAPHTPVIYLSPPFDSDDVTGDASTSDDFKAADAALTDMSSIVALYSAIFNIMAMKNRNRTVPYSITVRSEANQAFNDLANSVWMASAELAGPSSAGPMESKSYRKKILRTEIHLEFLNEVFKEYNLTKPALTQLDGLLTKFVALLSNIEVDNEIVITKHICQTITLHQVLRANLSGDDNNPIWVYTPVQKLIYLEINANSWSNTVNPPKNQASDDSVDFSMEYRVVDATPNVQRYSKLKDKFDQFFETLTNVNLQGFGNAIKTEPIIGAVPKS